MSSHSLSSLLICFEVIVIAWGSICLSIAHSELNMTTSTCHTLVVSLVALHGDYLVLLVAATSWARSYSCNSCRLCCIVLLGLVFDLSSFATDQTSAIRTLKFQTLTAWGSMIIDRICISVFKTSCSCTICLYCFTLLSLLKTSLIASQFTMSRSHFLAKIEILISLSMIVLLPQLLVFITTWAELGYLFGLPQWIKGRIVGWILMGLRLSHCSLFLA